MQQEIENRLASGVKIDADALIVPDPSETQDFLASSAENLSPALISVPVVETLLLETSLKPREVTSDEMLVTLWLKDRPLRTLEAYTSEWKRFSGFLHVSGVQGVELRRLSILELFDYRDLLATKYAPASQALALSSVKSLLKFGFSLGYLPRDLGRLLKTPKIVNQLPERILDEETVYRIILGEPDTRDRLILKLLYAAGVRVSELSSLKVRDLQPRGESGQLVVCGKGEKVRVILLSATTWSELVDLAQGKEGDAPLFQSQKRRSKKKGHLHRSQILRIMKKACERAGAPEAASPHWMRHAHATHSLERGCPLKTLQETLGHASMATTGKYLHVRPGDSSAKYLGI